MQIERKSTELSRRSKEESGGEEVYMMCILWAFLWMSVECQANVRRMSDECPLSVRWESFLAGRATEGGTNRKAIMIANRLSLGLGVMLFDTQFVALPQCLCLI